MRDMCRILFGNLKYMRMGGRGDKGGLMFILLLNRVFLEEWI